MRTITIVIIIIVVAVVTGLATFFVGKRYGQECANSGGNRVVVLNEDMVVLTGSGEAKGVIPAGTNLYGIPDPFGDKTSLFKLFLQTDTNDEEPLHLVEAKPVHAFECEVYALKSQRWLKSKIKK